MSLFSEPDTSLFSNPTTVDERSLLSNPTTVDESARHHAPLVHRSSRRDSFLGYHFSQSVPDTPQEWEPWEVPSLGSCRPADDPLPLEVAEFLDAPLTDEERIQLDSEMGELRHPGHRYAYEYCIEVHRISRKLQTSKAKMNPHVTLLSLQEEREPIVIRHRIRKRWQELGIWNPEWEFPYLQSWAPEPLHGSTQINWDWEWDSEKRHRPGLWVKHRDQGSDASFNLSISPTKVAEGALAREAEAFIVSRPWFIYRMHKAENQIRFKRVPGELLRGLELAAFPGGDRVRRVWEERGEWNDSWDEPGIKRKSIEPGWTWRDESPEPELDDILQFDTADLNQRDILEWEAIPLPSLSTMTWPPDRVLKNPIPQFHTP